MTRQLTENQLFQRALISACLDREEMIDCYSGVGPVAQEARELIGTMRTLKGRRLSSLIDKQHPDLFVIFVYAEQYERSLADAQAEPSEKEEPLALAKQFRQLRVRYWGQSVLEQSMQEATAVDIRDVPGILRERARG